MVLSDADCKPTEMKITRDAMVSSSYGTTSPRLSISWWGSTRSNSINVGTDMTIMGYDGACRRNSRVRESVREETCGRTLSLWGRCSRQLRDLEDGDVAASSRKSREPDDMVRVAVLRYVKSCETVKSKVKANVN